MHVSTGLAVVTALVTVAAVAVSPDPLLTAAAGSILVLALGILWPTRDAPILLLPFSLQWLSVAIKPIQSALTGVPLDELSQRGAALTPAAWLGIAGLLALALGMRLGVGRPRTDRNAALAREAAALPVGLIVGVSLAAIVGGHLLDLVAYDLGPAVQIALALSSIRLAGLFALTLWCVARRRHLVLLAGVVAFELVFGMTGFFSEFKDALLVFVIAVVAAQPRVRPASVVVGTAAFALLLVAGVYWSAIKPDYRDFLNEGSGQQIVVQPIEERVAYLQDAAQNFDRANFAEGLDALVKRQSYIDFLAHTIAHVPAHVARERRPHSGSHRARSDAAAPVPKQTRAS